MTAIDHKKNEEEVYYCDSFHMERFHFSLPFFYKVSWVSEEAREVWEDRLEILNKCWKNIEVIAIQEGLRACAIISATEKSKLQKAIAYDTSLVIEQLPESKWNTLLSMATKTKKEKAFVVGNASNITEFIEAWRTHDSQIISDLLNVSCWDKLINVLNKGYIDLTWPMTHLQGNLTDVLLTIERSYHSNILYWLNLTSAIYSFSDEIIQQMIQIGEKKGMKKEMMWLREIMQWSFQWSALHGIAEVKTPVVKISTATDATPIKYAVEFKGSSYPEEGAKGLCFPFNMPRKLKVSDSTSFKKGVENPISSSS